MSVVATAIIFVAVPVVMGLLVGAAKPFAETIEGRTTLHYGWGYRGFALFFGTLSLAVLVALAFVKPSDRIWIVALSLIFAIPSTPLLLSAFMERVVFSEAGIEAYSPWRKTRIIPWSDVTRFRSLYREHVVETRSQGKLTLSNMLSGVGSMVEELRRRRIPEA